MPGDSKRTSPLLVLLTTALCLGVGWTVPQPSATSSPINETMLPDMIVADAPEQTPVLSGTAEASYEESAENSKGPSGESPDTAVPSPEAAEEPPAVSDTPVPEPSEDAAAVTDTPAPQPTETPVPSPEPTETPAPAKKSEEKDDRDSLISPEAGKGTWASTKDGYWYYTVDGNTFHGWLHDTDHHVYYFNPDSGYMVTGIQEIDGKQYLFDEDGILQGELPPEKTEQTETKEAAATAKAPVEPDKMIALTFDDGPSSYTDRLLDCLEANNARATFFMVGTEIEYFPDAVRRMEALHCELGNHTYRHEDLTKLSSEQIQEQVAAVDNLLTNLAGHPSTVVRPPYGNIDGEVRSSISVPLILWSVDTLDWDTRDASRTVEEVLSHASDGAIILMHDIYSESVDAAEILIPRLISEGYKLVTVHELAAAKGVELRSGVAYGSMDGA